MRPPPNRLSMSLKAFAPPNISGGGSGRDVLGGERVGECRGGAGGISVRWLRYLSCMGETSRGGSL